ncbi:MAG: hypothetical protein KGL46_07830 [Hyphomicrobiales bacterium]|nr:hypothetical protein [Hyphomicrobiales bacterium]
MIAANANAHPLETLTSEDRRAALLFVNEAFAEAIIAGIDADSFADAAITAGLQELVAAYGEDQVAAFVARLPDRVRRGEFTFGSRH